MNFNSITPKKIVNTATVFKGVNFSFKKKAPINKAKIILVSLRAATNGTGACVKAQTMVP